MITVRPIRPDEIDAFATFGTDVKHIQDSVKTYLQDMLKKGAIRLDWCFVLEENGRMCGRAAYWTLPGLDKPLDLVLWELPWHRKDCLFLAQRLLGDTLRLLHIDDSAEIGHVLDSPAMAPQWQEYAEKRQEILDGLGFCLERETHRFERHGGTVDFAPQGNLIYRALPDVGEEAFVEAILLVSQSTGDRRISRERDTKGAMTQAWDMFREMQRMEYAADWWELAYNQNGQLVGLLMPAKAPAFATIGYIGVVPEQRGYGYIDQLLQRVSLIFAIAGETYIRADTDTGNTSMAKAFERAGYRCFAKRQEYMITSSFPFA